MALALILHARAHKKQTETSSPIAVGSIEVNTWTRRKSDAVFPCNWLA